MARIQTYGLDPLIESSDKLVGTDGSAGAGLNNTKNFTIGGITAFVLNEALATFVTLATNQTITGVKTFTAQIIGDISGNAETATILQTPRTIGGVSFNGSANIDLPGVNIPGNQNTSGNAATATLAATVTTNANLTGVVTSVGNATSIADGALSIAKTNGLQTELNARVPYTGANANVNLGAFSLTAGSLVATPLGTGSGMLHLKTGNSIGALGLGWTSIGASLTNQIYFYTYSSVNFKAGIFNFSQIADNIQRQYFFPNADGTVALTSNLTNLVPYNGATQSVDLGMNSLSARTVNSNGVPFGKGSAADSNSTALGIFALSGYTSPIYNTAVGYQALALTSGNYNTAIGWNTLFSNTNSNNVAIGHSAMSESNAGFENTAIGVYASESNTTGNANVAVGAHALKTNQSGNYNVGIGHEALRNNVTATDSTAVGYGALKQNVVSESTAFGSAALRENTTGQRNTAVGAFALNENTIGTANTAVGNRALKDNASSFNTAVGDQALSKNVAGPYNTAVGHSALENAPNSIENVAIGANTLTAASSTQHNTAVGFAALRVNQVSGNTAVGAYALNENTNGVYNIAVGSFALSNNQAGYFNTAIGAEALKKNVSGWNNTAIGYRALFDLATGTSAGANTAIGPYALSNTITGQHNLAIGLKAGEGTINSFKPSNSNFSIFIGNYARPQADSQTNQIVIGYAAVGRGSNTTVVGTDSTQASYMRGVLNIPEVVPRNYANDATAAANGILIGGVYHHNGALKIRIV